MVAPLQALRGTTTQPRLAVMPPLDGTGDVRGGYGTIKPPVVANPIYDPNRRPPPLAGTQEGDVSITPIYGHVDPNTGMVMPDNQVTTKPYPIRPPQQAPQLQGNYGLSGAEAAMYGGQDAALATLMGGFGIGRDYIERGLRLVGGAGGGGGGGFNVGAGTATAAKAGAAKLDQNVGQGQFIKGIQGIQAFSPAGLKAQQLQAALSGALGSDAQAQAFMDFQASPEQAWMREQQEQAVLRNAAATGGLHSGRVLSALQEQAQGRAAQDFQNRFNRLGMLSQQGLQAAGQAGQLYGQAGSLQAQMASEQARMQQQSLLQNAQLATQASISNAQNATQASIASSARQADMMRAQLGLFGQGAQLAANLAGQGAGIQADFGRSVGQMRYGAGQDLQRAIAGTTSNLANLQQQGGARMSDLIGAGSTNIANLISSAGQTGNQAALATLLANLAVGQGTAQAQGYGNIGQAQAQGALMRGAANQQLAQNQTAIIGQMLDLWQNSGNNTGG